LSYTKTKLFDAGISSKSVIAIPAWAQQMIDNGGEVNSTVDAATIQSGTNARKRIGVNAVCATQER